MDWITYLDHNILIWIQDNLRTGFLTPTVKFITNIGNAGTVWIILSLILLIPRQTRKIGILSLVSLLLGFLINNIWLKNLVARPRPFHLYQDILPLVRRPMDYSFPSGHTCSSFASACIIWYYGKKNWGTAALSLAVLIGLSRLYVGVHYPTDVIAGFLIGVCTAKFIIFLEQKRNKKETKRILREK